MSARIKKLFLVALSCLMVFSMSLVVLGNITVKAEVNPDTFTMIQGAQLRLETENNGIRFQAKIGANVYDSVKAEDGAYFGMIVVPKTYFEVFEDQLAAEDNDYVTVFTKELGNLGYTLWNRTHIEPYDGILTQDQDTNYKYMNAVVSNILYANYNVDRVAIAYYKNSTGYHYADGYKTNDDYVSRSVAELTESALQDKVTQYNEDQIKILNTFKYLADSSKNVVSESTANDNVQNYLNYLKNTKLTGNQVANFDIAGSDAAFMEMTGNLNNAAATTDYLENFEGAIGVLKFTVNGENNYGGKQIKFAKGVTVTADTVVNFKYYVDNNDWMKLKGAGLEFNTLNNVSYNSALIGEWAIKSIKATSLGYAEGDYMDGVEIFVKGSSCYLDEFTVTEDASYNLIKDLVLDTNDNGEVSNFDNYLYALNGNGINYVEDGETKALAIKIGNGGTYELKFKNSFVASTGDKIEIRVKFPNAFRVLDKSGNAAETFSSANYVVKTYDLIEKLGYKPGEIISSIKFRNNTSTPTVIYVDYIKVINNIESTAKVLTGNQVANYDSADGYASLIPSGDKNSTSAIADGHYNYATTENDWDRNELYLLPSKVEGQDYYDYKTVPADDANVEGYFVLKMKTNANFKVTRSKYRNATDSSKEGYQYFRTLFNSTASDWTYLNNNAWQIVIIPVSLLGFTAGMKIDHITFAHWGNPASTSIDWIEYVELDKGLNKQQAFNAYVRENNNVLIDFDNKAIDYSSQITKYSAQWDSNQANSADVNTWNYWSKNTTSQVVYYGDEGYNVGPDIEGNGVIKVAPGGQNYGGFGIKFDRPIYVTDDTKVTFRVYNASAQSFRLTKIGDTKTAGTQVGGITAAKTWSDVTVKLTNIGYKVDDLCLGVEIYFYGTNLYIDSITLA